MGTVTRPELSGKNPYWVERHRYYELKHFCMQYPIWKKAYTALEGLSRSNIDAVIVSRTGEASDPTAKCAEAREYYERRIALVEGTAKDTDPVIGHHILTAVIEGLSYDRLRLVDGIPCGKEAYYALYRRFFWLLDKRKE